MVHRLVLLTFKGPCPPGHESRHLDGNKNHNWLENLCWGTKEENAADTTRLGRQIHGESHHSAKLTRQDVEAILRDLAAGKSQQAIANVYGCNQMNVSKIKRGLIWKDVPRAG
jgi:hypothetical protein